MKEESGARRAREPASTVSSASLWSVILAGGEGERTRPFIERWLGYHKPKQYCTFMGDRSLFQRTIDRADRLGDARRRLCVVSRDHEKEALAQVGRREPGIFLSQPANRGTAAGVLLAMACIHAVGPGDVAVIYPSDHFVLPEERFVETIANAVCGVADSRSPRLVLVGVVPDAPEGDYGWILPSHRLSGEGPALHAVEAFVEKPSPRLGEALLARGALWNSMVVVGRVASFWKLAWRYLPELMPRFTRLSLAVGTSGEKETLDAIYRDMPARDFSKDLLQKAPPSLAVLPLHDVLWRDWGRPERIAQTLRAIGAKPAFDEEHLPAC